MDEAGHDGGAGLVGEGLEDGVRGAGVGAGRDANLLRQHDDLRSLGGEVFGGRGIGAEEALGIGAGGRDVVVIGCVGGDEADFFLLGCGGGCARRTAPKMRTAARMPRLAPTMRNACAGAVRRRWRPMASAAGEHEEQKAHAPGAGDGGELKEGQEVQLRIGETARGAA